MGEQVNCCDLMKGHAHVGEGLKAAAMRETWEECGIHLKDLKQISSDLQYTKLDTLTFFVSKMDELPDTNTLKCNSYFTDDYGKQLPEIVHYYKIPIDELPTYLYRGLSRLIVNNGLIDKIKDETTS